MCGFDSKSQKDFEAHLSRHADTMDKPYFCSHCDARFSTRKVTGNFISFFVQYSGDLNSELVRYSNGPK